MIPSFRGPEIEEFTATSSSDPARSHFRAASLSPSFTISLEPILTAAAAHYLFRKPQAGSKRSVIRFTLKDHPLRPSNVRT